MLQPEVKLLFSQSDKITGTCTFAMLEFPTFMTPKEKESFFFFGCFIQDAENGFNADCNGDEIHIDIASVYKWLTGSGVLIYRPDDVTVSFRHYTPNVYPLDRQPEVATVPRPVVKTCTPSLEIPVTNTYQEMKTACTEAVMSSIIHGYTLI